MAKRAKQEVKVVPEEKRLQDGLADGTCVTQNEFSMDVIGVPDRAYQGRVEELDAEHSRRFAAMLDNNIIPFPVVVFVSGSRCILVDGFHRHDAYRRKGRASIPAYVFTVPDDQLEHEARLYAAMCNQLATKTRGKNDERKAVEMLFADQVCWEWSNTRIADHCGCSPASVSSWRGCYASARNLDLPETVVRRNGAVTPYVTSKTTGKPRMAERTNKSGESQYYIHVGRQRVKLGTDKSLAQAKLDDLSEEKKSARLSLDGKGALKVWLSHRNISTEIITVYFGEAGVVSAIKSGDRLLFGCGQRSVEAIEKTIGRLILARCSLLPNDSRLVVVYNPEDYNEKLVDMARRGGIEFLTPDELVASIQAEDGQKEAS